MTSPLPRIAALGFLIWLVAGMPAAARAVERPSGFGDAPTASERELAAMPGPNAWFREMAGDWHGPRGLAPLRERWTGFAGEDPAFAVLAALVAEAEGDPDRTLAELRAVPGDLARWNEGRVLAILGRLHEAEMVLSALIPAPARPEVAAAAVLALTELDCIRGDFAAALARTTAAWELRREDDFRFRLLERHVSLLVEQRREGPFLENQLALAANAATEAEGVSAKRLLAAMAPWFLADARLAAAKTEVAALPPVRFRTWRTPGDGSREDFTWAVRMLPPGEAPVDPAWSAEAPSEWAKVQAGAMARRHDWPARLKDAPFLQRGLREQPLTFSHELFQAMDPANPPPPLLREMADAAATGSPEAVGLALDLVDRAWSGKVVAADAETLVRIIAAAPGVGGLRDGDLSRVASVRYNGWPALDGYPSGAVVWNLRGPGWANHYRLACRLAPLRFHTRPPYAEALSTGTSPSEWRPAFPEGGAANLMRWAWNGLGATGLASPERTAEILARLASPADRVLFAAGTGRTDLLAGWCREAGFAEELPSGAMNLALHSLVAPVPENPEAVSYGREDAVAKLVTELAKRVGLAPADLARSEGPIELALPARVAGEWGSLPVDPAVAGILGASSQNEGWRQAWEKAQPDTLPHPLWEMAVCPSVERIRWTRLFLENPPRRGATRLDLLLTMVFGGGSWFQYTPAPPALTREISGFGTAHPLRRWTGEWAALTEKTGRLPFFRSSFEPKPRPADPTELAQEEALRTLAAGDPDRLPLAVAAVELARDADARAMALSRLTGGGPFREGLFSKAAEGEAKVAAQAPVAEAETENAIDSVARVVTRLLAEPESRKLLEPAGAFSGLAAGQDSASALGLAWRRLEAADKPVLGERLLALGDPLAARLAVMAASAHGDREIRKTWVARALALFPEDPELLMAQAVMLSAAEEGQTGARDCFQRALRNMTTVSLGENGPLWCGQSDWTQGAWADPECVEAITSFAERARPAELATAWVEALENALSDPARLRELTNLRSAVSTLARYGRLPRPVGSGGNPFRWDLSLEALSHSGDPEAAPAIALELLLKLRGSLLDPASSGGDPQPAPPWGHYYGTLFTDRMTEGWRWLQLAKRNDPATLADRLAKAAAAAPEDEQKAMAAFTARGLARPLAAEDVAGLVGLSTDGRHRVVGFASWLLSPEQLPPTLCVDSWEALARALFTANRHNGTRSFHQGLDHMERLRAAQTDAGDGAVRRLLPAMLDCVEEMSSFPSEHWSSIIAFTRLSPDSKVREKPDVILAERLRATTGRQPEELTMLSEMINAYSEIEQMPPELVSRVEETLHSLAAAGWNGETRTAAGPLATAAAAFPRWHGLLRQLLPGNRELPEQLSKPWSQLKALFQALDSELALPELALRFEAGAVGGGTLHWRIEGLALFPEMQDRFGYAELRAPAEWGRLASGMAGGFDATVLARATYLRRADSVAGRVPSLAAEGSIPLTGIPPKGVLRLFLTGNETRHPAPAGMSREIQYNSLAALVDSAGAQKPVSQGPAGWHLLTEPVALTDVHQWQIDAMGGAMPQGISLLLLDEEGRVSAASHPRDSESDQSRFFAAAEPGIVLTQGDLPLWTPPASGGGDARPLRVTGPLRKMALAIPAFPSREGSPDIKEWPGQSGPPPRLTVRPWVSVLEIGTPRGGPPQPPAGRLEVVRAWSRSDQPSGQPSIGTEPLRAAWLTHQGLHVADLEGLGDAPVKVLTKKLDNESGGSPSRVLWQNHTLLVFVQRHTSYGEEPVTRLLRLRGSLEDAEPAILDIPGRVDCLREEWVGTPDVPLFQTANGQSVLHGILTADGRLLPWPENAGPAPICAQEMEVTGPSSFTFRDNEGRVRALNWTDGSPRLAELPPPAAPPPVEGEAPSSPIYAPVAPVPAPEPKPERVGAMIGPGVLSLSAGPLPLQVHSVRALGGGRYLGVGSGERLSFILMQTVARDTSLPVDVPK